MGTATKPKKASKSKKHTRKLTRLEVLIDESGSMQPRVAGVIEGYNEFMDSMRAEEGDLLVSLTMFDSRAGKWVRRKFEDVPVEDVQALTHATYQPYGGTPLHDALFETLESLGTRLEDDEQAIVLVMTDGDENQSRKHRGEEGAAAVKAVINARENDGWVFIYLGASHDVWTQSGGLGVSATSAKQFSGSVSGTKSSLRAAAHMTNSARVGGQAAYNMMAASTPDVLPDDYDPAVHNVRSEAGAEVTDAIAKAKGVGQ